MLVDVLDEAGRVADGCFCTGEVGELERELLDGGRQRLFLRFDLADLLLQYAGLFEHRGLVLVGGRRHVPDIAPAEGLAVGELGAQAVVLLTQGAAALLQRLPLVEQRDNFEWVRGLGAVLTVTAVLRVQLGVLPDVLDVDSRFGGDGRTR